MHILWNAVMSPETLLNGYYVKIILYKIPPISLASSLETLEVKGIELHIFFDKIILGDIL